MGEDPDVFTKGGHPFVLKVRENQSAGHNEAGAFCKIIRCGDARRIY
jgi:hypothetical protein